MSRAVGIARAKARRWDQARVFVGSARRLVFWAQGRAEGGQGVRTSALLPVAFLLVESPPLRSGCPVNIRLASRSM